jgi:hypothetical protein
MKGVHIKLLIRMPPFVSNFFEVVGELDGHVVLA